MTRTRLALSRREFITRVSVMTATPLLLGCRAGRPTEPGPGPSRLSARPGAPTVTPTTGLSQLGLEADRDGLLYVPESYAPDRPAPLFVALHGAGGEGASWASYPARAEARGMILLAPDSRASTWDLVRGSFGPDVAFLDRALMYTFQRCAIDPRRVALAGFSDGASYALSLGVSNGDLFTHLVAYSPGFFKPSPPIVGKPRIFASHGTQDTVLPPRLTRDGIVPGLRADGYDVTFREFDGGHAVPAEISEAALDWFIGVG